MVIMGTKSVCPGINLTHIWDPFSALNKLVLLSDASLPAVQSFAQQEAISRLISQAQRQVQAIAPEGSREQNECVRCNSINTLKARKRLGQSQ